MLPVLRLCWNPLCFKDQGGEADQTSSFDAVAFGTTLRSNMFFAYLDMCLKVNRWTKNIAAWAEGCYCHEPYLVGTSVSARRRLLQHDFGESGAGCPLQGIHGDRQSVATR
jgi:hypothetical protein